MFGIGTSELLVIAVIALMLFSPRELPKIVRSVSQLWASLRRTADEFRDAIMQEEAMQDLKDAVDGTKKQLRDAEGTARRELMKARMEMRRAENKLVKVARERERIEREVAASEPNADAAETAQGTAAVQATPDAGALAPAGTVTVGRTVSSGSEPATSTPATPATPATAKPATAKPATAKPKTVDPRHAAVAEPPPKSIDPRHAAAVARTDGAGGSSAATASGSGPDGEPPANQGAA